MDSPGCAVKWLRPLIYLLAAGALYRLWPARRILEWALLGLAILMVWTHANLRAAIKARRSADLAVAINKGLGAPESGRGSTPAVRFWLQVNILISAIVLALSLWAIAVSG